MAKPHYVMENNAWRVADSVQDTAHSGASATLRELVMWNPPRRSADADLMRELPAMVGRSRDIERNSGVAKGGIQTLVDNVVGTGLRLSSRPNYLALGKDKNWAVDWARRFEALFYEYWWSTACHAGDTMTGDQMTAQVFRSGIVSGDWVSLPLWMPDRGDGFATKMQTVDPDRLCNPNGDVDTPYCRGGIKFDDFGMPISYYIKKTHPGDSGVWGDWNDWEEIPRKTSWGRMRVLHGYEPDRAGQSRGKPLLSSVMMQFKQSDRYTNAEIAAAVANAMVAGLIYTDLDQDSIVELFRNKEDAYMKARQDHAVKLEAGSLIPLFPGDKVEPFTPSRPVAQFGTFMTNIYRIIAVALDIPYELLLKDFSNTNYATVKAVMQEAWRSFLRRRDWLGTQWMDQIVLLFMEEMVNANRIEAPGFYEHKQAYVRSRYIGPGRGWHDPQKEIAAAAMRISVGISTLEKECAEQGEDWRDILEQKAYEQSEVKRLGLTLTAGGTPSAPPTTGDGQERTTDGQGDPSSDATDDGQADDEKKPPQKKEVA